VRGEGPASTCRGRSGGSISSFPRVPSPAAWGSGRRPATSRPGDGAVGTDGGGGRNVSPRPVDLSPCSRAGCLGAGGDFTTSAFRHRFSERQRLSGAKHAKIAKNWPVVVEVAKVRRELVDITSIVGVVHSCP
jgi:hypothetical protein